MKPVRLEILFPLRPSRRVREREYVAAVMNELERMGRAEPWSGRAVSEIIFRCGATSFSSAVLRALLDKVQNSFKGVGEAPCTFEWLPKNTSEADLRRLKEFGVSRLDLPIYSFHPEVLKTLESAHSAEQVERSISLAREQGFPRLLLKLVYGVPRQSMTQFRYDITRLVAIQPDEVRYEPLRLIPGTRLDHIFSSWWRRRDLLTLPYIARMRHVVTSVMDGLDYQCIACNHFARGSNQMNSLCGEEIDRLGIGVGAERHYCDSSGQPIVGRNEADVVAYVRAEMTQDRTRNAEERVTLAQQLCDHIARQLRVEEEMDLSAVEQRFGLSLEEASHGFIDVLVDAHYVERHGTRIRLTDEGSVAMNEIIAEFTGLAREGVAAQG